MKLITEHNEELNYLTETKDGKKSHIIEGVFMQADQLNHNKRIYPKMVLEGAVKKYVENYVAKGRAVGELNHPEGPSINLDKVSHRITELSWNGNNVIGKAKILDTPMGTIVKGLLEGGCQLGVSSRGMGSVSQNKNGASVVNKDFILATVDIVQDPSAPSAFVNGIMEGVEYFFEGEQLVTKAAERIKAEADKLSINQLEEAQERLFSSFLKDITIDL
jgi:hypothetical protein